MSRRPADASLLAELLLCGPLTPKSVNERLTGLIGSNARNQSLQRLLTAILARFEDQLPPPLHRELAHFIEKHRWFRRVSRRVWPAGMTRLDLPRPTMQPPFGEVQSASVPSLVTFGDLADWLQISAGRLASMAGRFGRDRCDIEPRRSHYRYRWRSKSCGRWRLLEIPKPRLMGALRQIYESILSHVPVHESAHAFRPERSIRSAVLPHCGRSTVIHLDLQDFFTAVPLARVMMTFRMLGYPEMVARNLTGLCTNRVPSALLNERLNRSKDCSTRKRLASDHLPQGAPTSPTLSNLCSFRLDRRLQGLARQFDAHYSRYADDLIFSGDRGLFRSQSRFLSWVNAVLLDEGFALHGRKTRIMSASERQQVCELTLNARPNIARREFDRLKAILKNCVMYGPETQNNADNPRFREHLQGRVAWVTQINPSKGKRLQTLLDEIVWEAEE